MHLIAERPRLELATVEDSTTAISAGIGAGLRRCSIKWAERSRRGERRMVCGERGLGRLLLWTEASTPNNRAGGA